MLVLRAGNASLWTGPTGNNTYLLTGRVPALVDAGVGRDDHVDAVARALDGRPLALLLITHGHVDHAGGVPALVARWPGLRVRQSGGSTERLADGERIPAGDDDLVALATPGHSPDHCCFFSERTGDLFCGDLLREGGTIVIPASKGGDLRQYLASLRRIRELGPRRLLPGHGPAIDEPGRAIDAYLRHRAERDAQILQALADGHRTPQGIADHVYGVLPEPIAPAAADTVLAHLIKLEHEGRATRTEDGWRQAG